MPQVSAGNFEEVMMLIGGTVLGFTPAGPPMAVVGAMYTMAKNDRSGKQEEMQKAYGSPHIELLSLTRMSGDAMYSEAIRRGGTTWHHSDLKTCLWHPDPAYRIPKAMGVGPAATWRATCEDRRKYGQRCTSEREMRLIRQSLKSK